MSGSAARGVASVVALAACGACAAATWAAPPAAGDGAVRADSAAVPAGLPIARVVLDRRGVLEPAPRGRLGALFRLADHLHVRTREGTIRRQLLIAPGDRWEADRARESERALRALDIFDRVRIEALRTADSARVIVHTRDSWTTSPEFTLERGGGRTYGSIEFSERNLLGRAKFVSVAYREAPEGISRSFEVSDPAVLGSRLRMRVGAASGSGGVFNTLVIDRPFYAEDTRLAFGLRAERADNQVRLYASGIQAAEFPRQLERVELYAGLGRRRRGIVRRLTASWLTLDRTLGGSVLEAGAPAGFAGDMERLHLRRFAVEGRLWQPRFVERTRVDGLIGIEDIDLSRLVALTGGVSLRPLGGTANEGFLALRLGAGTDRHRVGFGWLRATGSSRVLAGLREAAGVLDARWVNQALPRHTLVVAALGAAGYRTARDYQLVVGGLNGLRAHPVHGHSGSRLWRLNAESRWLLGRELFQLVSIGAAGFWDAARTYGAGSNGEPWQHDLGFGLRLSLPGSAVTRVARFDIAWPVSPAGPGPREPVFSFSSSQAF